MLRPVRLVAIIVLAFFSLIPAPAAPPEAPPPRLALDPSLADWTPRPATGIAEEWEKAIEANWVDGRFRDMDTGPFLNCTMRYPIGKGNELVYKATVVKLGDKGGVVFDRSTMRLAAGWTGGWLTHSDRRFGLMNTPTPKGEMVFANPSGPGWADSDGKWRTKSRQFTSPLDMKWAKFRGMYLHGDRIVFSYTVGRCEVLDSSAPAAPNGLPLLVRSLEVHDPGGVVDRRSVLFLSSQREEGRTEKGFTQIFEGASGKDRIELIGIPDKPLNVNAERHEDGSVILQNNAYIGHFQAQVVYGRGKSSDRDTFSKYLRSLARGENLKPFTKGGPKRWGEPIVTKLVRGVEAGPFAVDTLTIPYKNRFNALFFCTGVDHLPDGRIAVSTCHGDVWLVTVDEKAGTCSWQRFATGLYHPLGLKVVDGKVVVLETGQLTRLHDLNKDGEADYYECITNDWHTGGGEHSYDTCLETDPLGNFYFFKTGDTHTPHGGCLMKVSKDGSKVEVFATGFRHPIGMGMSPTGILTGADQEGNWMPGTRIDEYKKSGFYGDFRAHHRKEPPKAFDAPLCWLPREVDNSAGGQVWVPPGTFGPLAGLPLHLSYGRCKPFVLLRQECAGGIVQAGVVGLDVKFLSGVCRGRFGPDGHLYVCGLNGWQTAAQADGCLQRVRYTGKPLDVPVKMVVEGNAIRLTFSRELDAKSVTDTSNYRAAWWNYIWSGEYGSKRWKVSDPKKEGQDEFAPLSARLLDDKRTVELTFEKLVPVMQMQVGYNLDARDGKKVVGSVYSTINSIGK